MAEVATEQSPPVAAAPESSTEVPEPSSTTAPASDATTAQPPATDDAPSKADLPSTTSNDATASTDPPPPDPTPPQDENATKMDVDNDTGVASAGDVAAANGTPDSAKKDNKRRKSAAAVPEHKNKALKKKQSMLNLDVKPGDHYFVRMKGYPPWPSVVCDEEMLPAVLLQSRPVSAMRIDGSYREDFLEGGKNARDRRYPVMFLGTNEFNWVVNTDLQRLPYEEIDKETAKETRGKKTLALWDAYHVASKRYTLDDYKDILREHEEKVTKDREEQAKKEALKAEKEEEKKKKAARKSEAKDEDGDETIVGTGDSGKKKTKTPKKRKDREEGEEAEGQPTGPKKIKIKNKDADVANEEPKKKETKRKSTGGKKDVKPPAEPQLTEKEKLEKKEKHVLYLRHRLQKGFLSRDQAPKEEEMSDMNGYFDQLEQCYDLEVAIIRATKINKVLKAILKLETIPKDEEHRFKERSTKLLNNWNKLLSSSGTGDADASAETPTAAEAPKPTLNGASHDDETKKSEEPQKDTVMSEAADPSKESSAEAGDVDVSMTDAKPAEPEIAAAPSAVEEEKPAPVAKEASAVA